MKLRLMCFEVVVFVSLTVASPGFLHAASGGTFVNVGDMTMSRIFHGMALLPDGKVLIAGGVSSSGLTASAEIYDPSAQTFTATGSMMNARSFCAAGDAPVSLANGKVFVVAGALNFNIISTAELFDEASGTFNLTGSMSTARACPIVTLLADGKVLVAGGYDQSLQFLNTAEIYDPATGTFSPTNGNLVTARGGAIGVLLLSGKVLIIGGAGNSQGGLKTAELYDPSSGTLALTGNLPTGLSFPKEGASRLQNGKVLVTGFGQKIPAYLYDPATGSFSATSQEGFEVPGEVDVTLKNGNVINVGPTGHLYVTSTGQFIDGPKMIGTNSAALLLNNGTVLVTGAHRGGLYVPK